VIVTWLIVGAGVMVLEGVAVMMAKIDCVDVPALRPTPVALEEEMVMVVLDITRIE
jgi:hypothetical protein